MEFNNLSELAAAKKHLREQGYNVEPINTLVGGRKGFKVENNTHVLTLSDYGVLAFASRGMDCLVIV